MFGLYDIDGILRFSCTDREACLAYAELLELPKDEYSLMVLPEITINSAKDHPRPAKSNN